MTKGLTCPVCKGNTLHQEDSVYKCSNEDCGFIGWGIRDEIINTGSGKGLRCPNCHKSTLKGVYELSKDTYIWRCTTCLYSGVGRDYPV